MRRHPLQLAKLSSTFRVATIAFCLQFLTTSILAQAPDVAVTERTGDSRTLTRITEYVTPRGRVAHSTNSYVELNVGTCYFKNGEWVDSKAEFQLFANGAVAQEGPFQLIISPDVSAEGSVDLLTPDGKRFISTPRWLAYYEPATGQSTIIAAVKSCIGELVAPNVIVFPDAFDDIRAAIRYTYTPGAIEQEVIFLESGPLHPEEWGFAPAADVVLEMWSEFQTAAEPDRIVRAVEKGLPDSTLIFGRSQIGEGKAFFLGTEEDSIRVWKTWTRIEQRQFLIEAVRQSDVAPMLAQLPVQAGAADPRVKGRNLVRQQPLRDRAALLARGTERLPQDRKPSEIAAIQSSSRGIGPGVTLDYSIVLTASGVHLKANTTYYVTNSVTLSGTTVIDGGTVVKFANGTNSGSNRLLITGPIDCRTSPYRPAFFTAKDDNTIGETISGSTGSPGTNRYGGRMLDLTSTSSPYELANLRLRYSVRGIVIGTGSQLILAHSQIGLAAQGVSTSEKPLTLRNVLFHNVVLAINSGNLRTSIVEHATIHRADTLQNFGTLHLTNSLLVSVTNGTSYTGTGVQSSLSDSGVFETVGAGARYLAARSSYRNAGTTNINTTLLSEIRERTTYGPVILSGDFLLDTTLRPQAPRDTDQPDLGYHYDSLDWCWSGKRITNTTVNLAEGVAIGFFDSSPALTLHNGAKFTATGSPTRMVHLSPYAAVQEDPLVWGSALPGALLDLGENFATEAPEIDLRFATVDLLQFAFTPQTLLFSLSNVRRLCLRDCVIRGGSINIVPQYDNDEQDQLVALTNNLFEGTSLTFQQGYLGDITRVDVHLRNNLFKTNTLSLLNNTNTTTWTVHDNVFDSATLSVGTGTLTNSYNGYFQTAALPSPTAGNVTLTAADYQTGSFGRTYYPTNGSGLMTLLNAGSRNATNAALANHTTRIDELAETDSVVDIGFHFLRASLSGMSRIPWDGDNDGIPDYLEDLNGNGSFDSSSGETDSADYDSRFGIGSGPGLILFTPLQ